MKENDFLEKKKSKKTGIIMAIIILLIIVLVVGGFLYYKMSTSKNVFKITLNNVFDYLQGNIVDYKTASGDFSFKVKINSNDSYDNDIIEIINKLDLSGSYAIDYENKLLDLNIKSNYDNKKLLDASIFTDNGKGYVYLDNVYDKYINIPLDDYDNIFKNMNKKDDYNVILNSVKEAINVAMLEDYFVKTEETIDGEKVNKTSLILNKDNYMTIKKDIINTLIQDDEFLKSFSSVSGEDITDIKNELNDLLEDNTFTNDINISIYTKTLGMKFVKLEISYDSSKLIIANKDSRYNYSYYENNTVIYEGSIKVEKNDNRNKVIATFKEIASDSSVEFTINSSVKYNTNINRKDVTNSIEYDKLSDDDINKIYNNIMNNEGFDILYKKISEELNSYNDSIDFDYIDDPDYKDLFD